VQAKALLSCSKAIRKAGSTIAATHLAQVQRCLGVLTTCVQLKPDDPACLTKARATCDKALASVAKADAAVPTALAKACAATTVPFANLLVDNGFGYDGELAPCARSGVPALSTLGDVQTCLTRQHTCAAERLIGFQYPRAVELLGLVGLDAAGFSCLTAPADGGGLGVEPEHASAVAKCQKAIGKAGVSYFRRRTTLTRRCTAAVLSCLQLKPADQNCLPKASASCASAVAKLPAIDAKIRATITTSCGSPTLALDGVLGSEGLGFDDLGAACALRGVPSLDSAAAIAECLRRQHACQADQVLENEMPRFRELLGLGAVTLP